MSQLKYPSQKPLWVSTCAITFINSQSVKLVFNEQPAGQVQDPKGFEYIVKVYYR